MPTFAPPSTSSSEQTESARRYSDQSELSFKSVEESYSELGNMNPIMNVSEGLPDAIIPDPLAVAQETIARCNEMWQLVEDIKCREQARIMEVEQMRNDMKEMISLLRGKVPEAEPSQALPTPTPAPVPVIENRGTMEGQKLKPIKWPEAYNHEDQSQWTTTHGILLYIYQRDVIERKFLQPGDFFMNLFSHAVSGTAKLMITGQFQEMMASGLVSDGLGLLKAMDDTFRDRNQEQTAAALLHACRQFKDESLSSFLPRFQQLLARSPSSTSGDKNKVYQLENSLNQATRNHLIGRELPKTFREFVEFLTITGSQIEAVGLVRTKIYTVGKIGLFDDGTKGVAGGRLLGACIGPSHYNSPLAPDTSDRDHEGDSRMTGVNKIRAKWVSRKEIERRKVDGECIRCGKKGHRIANCQMLPPQRPVTGVKTTRSDEEDSVPDNVTSEIPELKE